jgi:hypothetical protein
MLGAAFLGCGSRAGGVAAGRKLGIGGGRVVVDLEPAPVGAERSQSLGFLAEITGSNMYAMTDAVSAASTIWKCRCGSCQRPPGAERTIAATLLAL